MALNCIIKTSADLTLYCTSNLEQAAVYLNQYKQEQLEFID